jgi:aryl-alcohol dehydrogenase-like predicted oxidoreductase
MQRERLVTHRILGKSGLRVSALGFGCMGISEFRGEADENEGRLAIAAAIHGGITHFDTADLYGSGANEELLGSALPAARASITLATKCGFVRDTGRPQVNGTPAHLRAACEASLRRLKTDHVDLLYLHRVDPAVPIEDSVGALADLVRRGLTRWIGLSKVDVETLARAERVHPIAAVQMNYSLWSRHVETALAPYCRAHGIGLVAYSPLRAGAKDALHALAPYAAASRCTPAQLALAWLLARDPAVIPLPGMRTRAHVRENLEVFSITIAREVQAALETYVEMPSHTS